MRWFLGLWALLLASSATAYTIADYPFMFFEDDTFTAAVVRGSERSSAEITAANLIVNDLPKSGRAYRRGLPQAYYRYRVDHLPVTPVVDDRAAPRTDEIVIGTPCANARVRELLGILPTQCRTYLANQQGLIVLVEDDYQHLVITGSDGGRVLDATKILIDPGQRNKLRTKHAPIRRVYYRTSYQINGKEVLDIGQTIGSVTPTVYTSYPHVTYRR